MNRRYNPFWALILTATLATGSCSPLGIAIGAGASAGIAATEERGIEGTAKDATIRFKISELWLDQGLDFYHALEMQIYEGRVLLSGQVPTQTMADTAVRLAWQPEGVVEVINEIVVRDGDLTAIATDTLAATRLRTELTFTKGVQAINYSIRVVDGTVYLIGVAQDKDELARVIRTARALSGVRDIVSHVWLKDDPRRTGKDGK